MRIAVVGGGIVGMAVARHVLAARPGAEVVVFEKEDELVERFYDDVPVRSGLGPHETFYAIDKARELLGYEPEHSWRDVLDAAG